jgi:hypothetical protein
MRLASETQPKIQACGAGVGNLFFGRSRMAKLMMDNTVVLDAMLNYYCHGRET